MLREKNVFLGCMMGFIRFRAYITFASMAFSLHSGLFFRQQQRGFWLYHEVLKGVLSGRFIHEGRTSWLYER